MSTTTVHSGKIHVPEPSACYSVLPYPISPPPRVPMNSRSPRESTVKPLRSISTPSTNDAVHVSRYTNKEKKKAPQRRFIKTMLLPTHSLPPSTKEAVPLLNPLLPLLGVDVPRRAQPALMPRHQRPQHLVLAHLADRVMVSLSGPRSGVEFRPVDLSFVSACPMRKGRGVHT